MWGLEDPRFGSLHHLAAVGDPKGCQAGAACLSTCLPEDGQCRKQPEWRPWNSTRQHLSPEMERSSTAVRWLLVQEPQTLRAGQQEPRAWHSFADAVAGVVSHPEPFPSTSHGSSGLGAPVVSTIFLYSTPTNFS